MKIITIGNCCKDAVKNHENACIAAKNCGVDEPHNITDIRDMIRLGVFATPSLIIDGAVISQGKLLSVDEIERLIGERL